MAMPDLLVFVRHGESEGNIAMNNAKNGDESFYTEEFIQQPGRQWRLTKEGQDQARKAGKWIKENLGDDFHRYYVSPYIRTRETAAYLNLANALWKISRRLRERDYGDIGSIPKSKIKDLFPHNDQMRMIDFLYWRPTGGESMADVQQRVREFFDTLHRECSEKSVLVVTHGEFISSAWAELEYLSDEEWHELGVATDKKINNCHIQIFTRIDPATGKRADYLQWMKRIDIVNDAEDSGWVEIKRPAFTNEDLIEQVSKVKRIFESEE